MTAPLLSLQGITACYGNITALHGVSLDVPAGQIVTLIGANGAGKSTLMMTIFGNPRARDGRIHFDGRDITEMPTHEIARLGLAQSPEGRRIFGRMTVEENLRMGAEFAGHRDYERELAHVTAIFPRLRERLHQRGGTLSGGEQQMLAIARCLMMRPKLIILDEPTEGIMPLLVSQIRREIHRINQSGVSILLVEQNVETALKLCPRVFLMEKGTVVYSGTSHELKSQTAIVHRYLGLSR
jgi:branched-chain amino acid transport system ATP-binding protein